MNENFEKLLSAVLHELRSLRSDMRGANYMGGPPVELPRTRVIETSAQRTEVLTLSEERMHQAAALLAVLPVGMRMSEVEEALGDARALAAHTARAVRVSVVARHAPEAAQSPPAAPQRSDQPPPSGIAPTTCGSSG